MKALRNVLDTVLKVLAGGSLLAMTVLTAYQVFTRYLLSAPSTWSEELVSYLFAWSTLFGAAIVTGERGHMNIPILVDAFPTPVRKAFYVFAEVVAFLFAAAILVFGGIQVSSLAMGQMTSSLGVAVGLFYWVMPLCGVVMVLYTVLNVVGILRGEISPEGGEEERED